MKPWQAGNFRWLLVAVVAVWFGGFALWPAAFPYVGVNHYGVWFLDAFAILASNDAVVRGLDPYVPNPLDYFNRPHVYSPWWLELHRLGLGRAQILAVGWTLTLGFLAAALGRLRPQSLREAGWYAVIVGAPPVLLGVNRANNDLLIFALLAPVVPCLLDGRRTVRLFALVLIALAAGLKFFPAAAGLVLLAAGCGDARETRARLALAALALVLVAAHIAPNLPQVVGILPKAEGLMTFGAVNLPAALGLPAGMAKWAGLVGAAAWVTAVWRARWTEAWRIAPEAQAAWLGFVLGGVLLTGCFLTGTNYGYRWVFGIWLAPLLWRLRRDAMVPCAVQRWARITAGLLVFSIWADALLSTLLRLARPWISAEKAWRIADTFFALEQPLTWAFFAGVLVFLTHFVREGLGALLGRGR
jgi:hypothetical protein